MVVLNLDSTPAFVIHLWSQREFDGRVGPLQRVLKAPQQLIDTSTPQVLIPVNFETRPRPEPDLNFKLGG